MGWIGVDLDGTLAIYDGWVGEEHIGPPVPKMVQRVKDWLSKGVEIRIFTARVTETPGRDNSTIRRAIEDWCLLHIGQVLPITNIKDFAMIELWDDRAVRVIANTGEPVLLPIHSESKHQERLLRGLS